MSQAIAFATRTCSTAHDGQDATAVGFNIHDATTAMLGWGDHENRVVLGRLDIWWMFKEAMSEGNGRPGQYQVSIRVGSVVASGQNK